MQEGDGYISTFHDRQRSIFENSSPGSGDHYSGRVWQLGDEYISLRARQARVFDSLPILVDEHPGLP